MGHESNKFKIQTDHRALIWLHNVKDPSSRLLRWRLRMDEYDYEIEIVKGKENKVADCVCRLFSVQEEDLSQQALENIDLPPEPERLKADNQPIIIDDQVLEEHQKIKLPHHRIIESFDYTSNTPPETVPDSRPSTSSQEQLHDEFINWRLNPITGRVKNKPNAIGKLWKEINKEDLLPFNEENWLRKLGWLVDEFINKKLTMIRLIFNDPLITPIEKEVIQEMLEFLSNFYPDIQIHMCFSNKRELNKIEKEQIIREAHSNHLEERNTIKRAKKLGLSTKGNKYILSLQDRLTTYTILMPIKNETIETIISEFINHNIYTFEAPKTILSDQGQNFLSELMQQFEEALNIQHIKTTAF